MITQERLKELIHYNPETGLFTHLVSRGPVKAGNIAGSLNAKGYIQITIDYEVLLGHRVAYFYMTGKWPLQVDHIDLHKANNKWSNLRAANNSDNHSNTPKQKNNTSGLKGVSWSKVMGKWTSEIKKHGVKHRLGYSDCKAEMHLRYTLAAEKLCGEFARSI